MRVNDLAMQEKWLRERAADRLSVDTASADFYSYGVIYPTHSGATCCCMCLPPCG